MFIDSIFTQLQKRILVYTYHFTHQEMCSLFALHWIAGILYRTQSSTNLYLLVTQRTICLNGKLPLNYTGNSVEAFVTFTLISNESIKMNRMMMMNTKYLMMCLINAELQLKSQGGDCDILIDIK